MRKLGFSFRDAAYYEIKLLERDERYGGVMSKRVISFRLSDEELQALDAVCKRFRMNRSQAVNAGIAVLLREYVDKDGSFLRRVPWLITTIGESEDVEH